MSATLALGGAWPELKSSEFEKHLDDCTDESILEEYELIKQKKSKLSANKRRIVAARAEYILKRKKL